LLYIKNNIKSKHRSIYIATKSRSYSVSINLKLFSNSSKIGQYVLIARIELDPGSISNIIEPSVRKKVVEKLKIIGFDHIVIDMEGYRSGSMDGL